MNVSARSWDLPSFAIETITRLLDNGIPPACQAGDASSILARRFGDLSWKRQQRQKIHSIALIAGMVHATLVA